MKNRKLFAIITLVAFMLTMMPMMAFAATASNSSISVEDANAKVSVKAEGADVKDALEFVVDLDGDLLDTQRLVIFAERNGALSDVDYFGGSVNHVWNDAVNKTPDDCGMFIIDQAKVNTMKGNNQNNEFSFYVASETAGTITLKAYIVTLEAAADWSNPSKPTKAELYNGSNDFIMAALVGNGCTGKFSTTDNDIKATVEVVGFANKPATGDNAIPFDGKKPANNGVDYYDVTMRFTKGGAKLVGEDVTISVDKNGATVNKEEVTTSATGKIDFKVSASKAGKYTVTVECGTFTQELVFTFDASQITKLEFSYTVDGTIAVDNNETVAMQVRAYDANGNVLAADKVGATKGGVEKIDVNGDKGFVAEVISAPEDSTLEETFLPFYYNTNVADNVYISFEPDAAGTYTIKVYSEVTGVADTTTIVADEFGTIDHATISYPSNTYSLGAKTQAPTIKVVDTNGVKKNASAPKFSYSGLGVAEFNAGNGQVTFKSDAEYAGKEVVVSVVANNKYSATTTLTIGASASSLQFTAAQGEVGEEVTVNAQVVDVNGNNTAVSATGYYDVALESAIIVERPAGANVSVDADYFTTSTETFLKKGTGKVLLTSNKEGTVKANIVLKLTAKQDMIVDGVNYSLTDEYVASPSGAFVIVDGEYVAYDGENDAHDGLQRYAYKAANPYVFYLTGTATAAFGEGPIDTTSADDIVTFIIGTNTFIANDKAISSDVAPYIVDGRTFIPVRAFVEATGATIEYDAATQVVTIKGNGIDAQMTIGSNILTVNGETVVMDTAAAIKDGRTVLPVRYAGQAIGYDFECAYGADGAVTAVTMYK